MKRLLPLFLLFIACQFTTQPPVQQSASESSSSSSSDSSLEIEGVILHTVIKDERWQTYTDPAMRFVIEAPRYTMRDEQVRTPIIIRRYGERFSVEPENDSSYSYSFWAAHVANQEGVAQFEQRIDQGKCAIAESETADGIQRFWLEAKFGSSIEDAFACSPMLSYNPNTGVVLWIPNAKNGGGWPFMFEDEGAMPQIQFLHN